MAPVMLPISSCWGSSLSPGAPRWVMISKTGMRNTQVSEVSGLTALPSPEFCIITTVGSPPSAAPAPMATASPSFAAKSGLLNNLRGDAVVRLQQKLQLRRKQQLAQLRATCWMPGHWSL